MKTNTLYLLIAAASLALAGCEREDETIVAATTVENINNQVDNQPTFSIEQRAARPIVLGKQKENPYSVSNMQIALDSLRAYARAVGDDELRAGAGVRTKSLDMLTISATDLYVRFLPRDSAGYAALSRDTTLELFAYPLDYEIVQAGDYYLDPDLPDSAYSWLYAVVKPGYQPPQGVTCERLAELFLMENSEGYSEEIISEAEVGEGAQTKSAAGAAEGAIDNNLRRALTATSFVLTGNGGELRADESGDPSSPRTKRTVSNCKRRCILWGRVCWTSCDYKYYPEGYIKVNTPSGEVPLKGIKVRTSRWFHSITMRTNSSGYYSSGSYYYDDILIGNSAYYDIYFDGANGSNSWTFSATLFGALCFWTSSYGAGYHSPNGHSMTFHTNSDYWGRAVLHNAVYDYVSYAKSDGVSLPPASLDIASKNSSDWTSSAPLLKNHVNISLFYASPVWGTLATIYGYALLGWAMPDLILRYNKDLNSYNTITAIAWHELTHASQLQRMKSEKNAFWASDYWSHVVLQEVKNHKNTGGSYGSKGDDNWQVIALAEGWAYYREEYLARTYLPNATSFVGTRKPFLTPYVEMFRELRALGCTFTNMEKSLCTYSISGFRDNLIAKHSNLSTQITSVISSRL
jgi:hypothetical protein